MGNNKKHKNMKNQKRLFIPLVIVFATISVFGFGFFNLSKSNSNIVSTSAASNPSADLNSDSLVNVQDLSILISKWATNSQPADINKDGIVNVQDLSILISSWGAVTQVLIKPDATNTGVPTGQALTVPVTDTNKGITVASNGNVTISKSGTFTNMLIKGRLTLSSTADNVIIKYSRIEANPTPWDLPEEPTSTAECLVNVNNSWQAITAFNTHTSLVIEDSEIEATRPSTFLGNGIHGYNMTLTRVDISKTVDGVGIFRNGATNTTVQNSYIHDLFVGQFSPGHGCDEPTHTDGIQLHYGSNSRIIGNNITPNSITAFGATSAIMVNENGGIATTDTQITNNWLNYGSCSVNVYRNTTATGLTGLYINSNIFGKNQQITKTTFGFSHPCAMTVDNITRSVVNNQFNGNVWEDGSTPNPPVENGGN